MCAQNNLEGPSASPTTSHRAVSQMQSLVSTAFRFFWQLLSLCGSSILDLICFTHRLVYQSRRRNIINTASQFHFVPKLWQVTIVFFSFTCLYNFTQDIWNTALDLSTSHRKYWPPPKKTHRNKFTLPSSFLYFSLPSFFPVVIFLH